MLELRRTLLLVLSAGLILGFAANMADAQDASRGGSRGGQARGSMATQLKPTTQKDMLRTRGMS